MSKEPSIYQKEAYLIICQTPSVARSLSVAGYLQQKENEWGYNTSVKRALYTLKETYKRALYTLKETYKKDY